MIDFIKNIFKVNKDVYKLNMLEQMSFEDRLDYFKNNDTKLHTQQRDRNIIYFL